MSSAKLSETDKQAILERYQQTDDTASALAEQFGVSASTVGRILKTGLGEASYQELSRRKRGLSRTSGAAAPVSETPEPRTEQLELPQQESEASPVETADLDSESAPGSESSDRRRRSRRRRSSAASRTGSEAAGPEASPVSDEVEPSEPSPTLSDRRPAKPVRRQPAAPMVEASSEDEGDEEDLEIPAASISTEGDEFGEDDFEDFGEDESGDADSEGETALAAMHAIDTRPLESSTLPRSCYIVVDRLAELVTCSPEAFQNLGLENASTALPVFDSPRSARRFCNKNQRVIKVPDSQVLLKTRRWLVAKGIDRLLLDGNFYALT